MSGGGEAGAAGRFGPRRALDLLLLVAAAVVFLVPLAWGTEHHHGLATDEVRPGAVRQAVERLFSGGWATPYPPMLYYVLGATFGVVDRLAPGLAASDAALLTLGRGLSALVALGTVALLLGLGRRLGLEGGARAAAAFWAASPTVAYYAKTSNVESLYLFFLVLAIDFLVRHRDEGRGVWLAAAAASGVAAVASKDQAGAYLLLAPALALVWRMRRERELGARAPAALGRALASRELLGAAALSAVLLALALNLPFNAEGVREHYRIVARQPDIGREYASDAAGRLDLAGMTGRNLVFVLGVPGVLLGALGVARLLRDRARLRRHLPHLTLTAGYLAFFWWTVPRSYDRLVLPAALSGVLLAGEGWRHLVARSGAFRPWVLALLVGALAYSGARAVELDLRLLRDSRDLVRLWIAADGGSYRTTWVVGPRDWTADAGQLVQLGDRHYFYRILRRHRPLHLVADAALADRKPWKEVFAAGGYAEVWRSAGPIPARLSRTGEARSNLDKISRELVVLRRLEGVPADASAASPRAADPGRGAQEPSQASTTTVQSRPWDLAR